MFYQIIFIIGCSTSVFGNFYDILGVSRSATDFDIKNSYKKLARLWHPDKNKSPGANDHFTKINEAYEALSNPDKRREYDAFGSISNEPRGHGNNHGSFWTGGNFGNSFFEFDGNDQAETNFETTNFRHYKIDILPNSIKQPALILLVSHFCFSCHHSIRLWNSIAKQVTESGIRILLADIMTDAHLREELQIQHVPTVVMIINGQVRFMQSEINKETVTDFIRYSFPSNLVESLQSQDDLNAFHNSWNKDSRSKMIMTKPLERPSFRYLSIAFKYRDRISAGFIQMVDGDDETFKITDSYDLRTNQETVLIFHDEKQTFVDNIMLPKPVAKISQVRLTLSEMESLVQSNYMLPFPRLLSQSVFDLSCISPSQRQRSPGFCVIVVIDSKHKHNLSDSDSWHRVRSMLSEHNRGNIMYLFGDEQRQFLQSLRIINSEEDAVSKLMDQVILLWRQSYSSATTLLLSDPWENSKIEMVIDNWDTFADYDSAISILNSDLNTIGNSDTLSELVNELAPPLWLKLCSLMISYIVRIYSYIYETLSEPFTVIVAILGIVLVSYVFSTCKAIVTHVTKDGNDKQGHQATQYSQKQKDPLSGCITQLTDDSYNGMIHNLEPGHLICVLLTTRDTPTDVMLSLQACIARLNDKHLSAVSLAADINPLWLRSLFIHMSNSDDHRSGLSSINGLSVDRPFIYEGIVLALNISRCYLSICPVNLMAGPTSGHRAVHKRSRDRLAVDMDVDSWSSGDQCSSCSSDESLSLTVQSRFFDWLCQLTEGTCRRYYVSQWPATLHC